MASMAYLLPGVPIYQPAHLEGDVQFATEILPGPPSVAAAVQAIQKRDPKKPLYSYLPSSDPGSTYSGVMHGTVVANDLDRAKRSRTTAGRAQRASARQQNGFVSVEGPVVNETHDMNEVPIVLDDEPTLLSRSSSAQNILDEPTAAPNGRQKRKDKGKAKEIDPVVKIKEEPTAISLLTPEPAIHQVPNEDHCSSCRATSGALVYCDGCPRSFHLWCLNPPMENADNISSVWYCAGCQARKHPPRKPTQSLFSPLVHVLNHSIPTEFQLPDDIRTFFKDVATNDKGAYVDNADLKPPRLNRHGQLEERDSHRLRDKNGHPVLCFRCGTSALPETVAATAPSTKRARKATAKAAQYELWKNIISCDYCNLHWHLDCLDPPLLTMPSFSKKWMCPNHSERILHPKRRIPKQNAAPIEITKPKQFNNGNIDVIQPETVSTIQKIPKVSVDEVLINGRRYRVPERIVLLDFWSKISKNKQESAVREQLDAHSGVSSPLTSLSSLDDLDEPEPSAKASIDVSHHTAEDLKVAQMLCNLRVGRPIVGSSSETFIKRATDIAVQTEPTEPVVLPVIPSTSSSGPRVISAPKRPFNTTNVASTSISIPTSSATKRKRAPATKPTLSKPSSRELRSRNSSSRNSRVDDVEMSDSPSNAAMKSKSRVKMEETDPDLSLINGSRPHAKSRTAAPRRRKSVKDVAENGADEEITPRRGRKRKERDDEGPYTDRSSKGKHPRSSITTREKARTGGGAPLSSATATSSLTSLDSPSGSTPVPPSVPTTPLKIRLPRLNLLNSPSQQVSTASARS